MQCVRKHLTEDFLCAILDLSWILCSLLIPEYSGIFFLSLSLSQANSLECRSSLSSLSCPGFWDSPEKVHFASAHSRGCLVRTWSSASLCVKGFIGFLRKPRNISFFLSLFYFLIIDSKPPGSGPLKDLNKWHPEQGPGTRGRFGRSDSRTYWGW